ncbi:hypothetical protein B0H65DRAFT_437766 [Neurospora tetraspora]|uniref:Uncharacterized protein n=1 Tax=Neurospora tetraspora TaxID=94610 RepID=A0AAE0JNG9_9PEZI|nr:hypothetical protein B0H65DRAFT_437766 [Neurospora tetraspora]
MYGILKNISRKLEMLSVKLPVLFRDEFMFLSTFVPEYIPDLNLDWVMAPFRRFESFEHRFRVARKNFGKINRWDKELAKLELLLAEVELTVQKIMDMHYKISQGEDFADRDGTAQTIVEVTFTHLINRMDMCHALELPWGDSTPKQTDTPKQSYSMVLKLPPNHEKPASAEYIRRLQMKSYH